MSTVAAGGPVVVAGRHRRPRGSLALARRGFRRRRDRAVREIGEIGAGIQLASQCVRGDGRPRRGRGAAPSRRVRRAHDHARCGRRAHRGQRAARRAVSPPLRRQLRRHPSCGHPPLDPRGRAARAERDLPHVHARGPHRGRRRGRARPRCERPRARRRRADRRRRRQIGRARRTSSAMRTACPVTWSTAASCPATTCRRTCAGTPRRVVGPNYHLVHYPLRRRRAVQPRRHVPQPRAGGMGRARRLAGGDRVLFRPRSGREPRQLDHAADVVEALVHRRPRSRRDRWGRGRRRSSAMPRIRRCSTWRRVRAWRSRMR